MPMLNMSLDVVDNASDREHQGFLEILSEAHLLQGDRGSDWNSVHSTVMRASSNSHRSAQAQRGLWVKVNLPIFKDEKVKDALTCSSWWWDVAIFHQSGWDDQHLLLYVFHSQGFPGNLASSLGKDATLSDVLQMLRQTLWCCIDVQCAQQGTLFPQ